MSEVPGEGFVVDGGKQKYTVRFTDGWINASPLNPGELTQQVTFCIVIPERGDKWFGMAIKEVYAPDNADMGRKVAMRRALDQAWFIGEWFDQYAKKKFWDKYVETYYRKQGQGK
jgi:hypothetical protein